jgi:translation initiation factor 3 subunit G
MTVVQSSWADEIEEGDSTTLPAGTLPMPSESIQGNKKITTEYSINDDGKKTKIVRTFEIIKKQVPKAVAQRKALPKFGMSRNDRPGPDPATTIIAEEIFMNFVHNKEEHEKDDDKSALDRLKETNKGVVKCRICKEDHWTTQCPYKDKIGLLKDLPGEGDDKASPTGTAPAGGAIGAAGAAAAGAAAGAPKGAYVAPGRREGGRVGESMNDRRRTEDTAAIRVSNLSESTQEADLQELFKPFGHIARIYLSKDKMTGECRGFAFVHYYKKDDAQKAIATLNGFGYDHLILNVEWAKPSEPK